MDIHGTEAVGAASLFEKVPVAGASTYGVEGNEPRREPVKPMDAYEQQPPQMAIVDDTRAQDGERSIHTGQQVNLIA